MSDDLQYEEMRGEYMMLRARVLFGQDPAAEAQSEELARAMREYCTVNGHDLHALGTFLRDADYEVVSHFSPT